ncbi:hypothetical protein J1N35_008473 [Gossypium stocksii]|uniref:Uncharacterized protein n=1 Tax=Gossypium stocksii TaxID=47602 RepID=A0A9D4AGI5_9ROSI|nr:hypothetical protein J1N35_008473 [Gossypium stocksii]
MDLDAGEPWKRQREEPSEYHENRSEDGSRIDVSYPRRNLGVSRHIRVTGELLLVPENHNKVTVINKCGGTVIQWRCQTIGRCLKAPRCTAPRV